MSAPGARDALIVAVTDYQDSKLHRLRSPAIDATALRNVLADPDIGDFQVDVLLDPDERTLRRKLASFFRSERHPQDLLVVHFSCHGVKDENGELYLAATDTEHSILSATAISTRWLNELVTRCRSKSIVMLLDCCFSGSFPFGVRARAGTDVDAPSHLQGRGRAVISSSNAMEYAYEGDELTGRGQPSVFTHAVVEGLRTGGADRDHDHQVSLQELYDYVFDHVREATPNQTPNMMSTLEGALYLARSTYEPPVEPAQLEPDLTALVGSNLASGRRAAVEELAQLVQSVDSATRLAASQALQRLADDDSKSVSQSASDVLAASSPPEPTPPASDTAAPLVPPRPDAVSAPAEPSRPQAVEQAEAGDTKAKNYLGMFFDQARRWYQQAADAGDTEGMVHLGDLLAYELDPPELDEARRWFQQAADAGDADGMNNLGNILEEKLDPPELDEARRWYQQAADAGHTGGMNNLGDLLANKLEPPELELARHWLELAAGAGEIDAMVNLGVLLEQKLDPPELDEARHWYQQAADAGDTDAKAALRRMGRTK
jgi:TPR repeat protein